MKQKTFKIGLLSGVANIMAAAGACAQTLPPQPPPPGHAVALGQAPGAESPTLSQPQPSPDPSAVTSGVRADAGGTELSTVIVTARKTNETELQTPVALSVYTSAGIQSRDITTLDDISAFTPGVNFTQSLGSQNTRTDVTYVIRGIAPQAGGTTVSIFLDGAPVTSGFVEGVDDADRVEILKGPQSAAFGRQVFAGAVNIITKLPSDQWHLTLNGEGGSYNRTDDRVTVEGPIIPDKLLIRLTGRYFSTDGQYANGANPGERLGDQSTEDFATTIYATPVKGLRVKLFASYDRLLDGPSADVLFDEQDYNCNTHPPSPIGNNAAGLNYICGTLPTNYNYSRLAANDDIDALTENELLHNSTGALNPIYRKNLGLNRGGLAEDLQHSVLTVDYDLPFNFTVTSLTGVNRQQYVDIQSLTNQNGLGVPNPYYGAVPGVESYSNWQFDQQQLNQDYSEEVRLAGSIGSLKALLGASYLYSYNEYESSALTPFGLGNFVNGNPTTVLTRGLFFSLSYDILHNVTIDFDGRYQSDHVGQDERAAGDGPVTKVSSGVFHNFIPRAIIQWRPRPNYQLYASYSVGINPGQFNGEFLSFTDTQKSYFAANYPGVGYTVQPEKLTNYEIGLKGDFIDRRLQVTAAAYYAIWSNQIVTQSFTYPLSCAEASCPYTEGSFNTNIGQTMLDGFELETDYRFNRQLSFQLTGSINASDIQKFQSTLATEFLGNPTVKGTQLPNYSKYNLTFSANYTDRFAGGWDYFVRSDAIYKSGMYDTVLDLAQTPDYFVVNLRTGLTRPKQRVEFYVTNLFDNKAYLGINNNVNLLSSNFSGQVVEATPPILREIGVRFRQSF